MILTKRYKESAAVTPCARCSFGEKGLPIDIHLVVKYAVHHSKAVLAPSVFQCWPASIVEQGSYAAAKLPVT